MSSPAAAFDAMPQRPASAGREGRWAKPELERDLADLDELRGLAMSVARALARQITEGVEIEVANDVEAPAPPPAPSHAAPLFRGDLALGFHRVSRAVRMTAVLRSRLIEQIETFDELQARRLEGRQTEQRAARKAQVGRLMTDIIGDAVVADADALRDDDLDDDLDADAFEGGGERCEAEGFEGGEGLGRLETDLELYNRLVVEASERLSDSERYGDVLARPISDYIAAVCRDLGLSPDWRALSRQPWAEAERASGQVGAPLSDLDAAPAHHGDAPAGAGAHSVRAHSVRARDVRARGLRRRIAIAPDAVAPAPPASQPRPARDEDDGIPWIYTDNGSKIYDPINRPEQRRPGDPGYCPERAAAYAASRAVSGAAPSSTPQSALAPPPQASPPQAPPPEPALPEPAPPRRPRPTYPIPPWPG